MVTLWELYTLTGLIGKISIRISVNRNSQLSFWWKLSQFRIIFKPIIWTIDHHYKIVKTFRLPVSSEVLIHVVMLSFNVFFRMYPSLFWLYNIITSSLSVPLSISSVFLCSAGWKIIVSLMISNHRNFSNYPAARQSVCWIRKSIKCECASGSPSNNILINIFMWEHIYEIS